MNKRGFLELFPERKPDSNKFDNGRILLVGGSYGMTGALGFNITGARCLGASYIHVCLPDSIYPIMAVRYSECVYHPESLGDLDTLIQNGLLNKVSAIGIGSGLTNHPHKEQLLHSILKNSTVPVIVDAEGLRILAKDDSFLQEIKCPVILTPHTGEFSALTKLPVEELKKDLSAYASRYAREHRVYVVIKDASSYTCAPDGRMEKRTSGNDGLARAGSGDVLTGILTAACALIPDVYDAVRGGVWFHGHLADLAVSGHSRIIMDFDRFPELADAFFAGYR